MDTDIDLNIALTEIPNLSTDMLKRYYVRLYEMPAHCSNRMFYILRVSYRLQELRFGGLSSVSKGFIRKMFETPQPKKPAPNCLSACGLLKTAKRWLSAEPSLCENLTRNFTTSCILMAENAPEYKSRYPVYRLLMSVKQT